MRGRGVGNQKPFELRRIQSRNGNVRRFSETTLVTMNTSFFGSQAADEKLEDDEIKKQQEQ
jgi:hypothetical protein